jgi:hypothetical protein
MDRQIVYPLAIPYETDFLYAQRFTQEAVGLLAMDILGAGPVATGLACTATAPPSLAVQIAPGRLYQTTVLDATAYGTITGGNPAGGLAADLDMFHSVLKQGVLRDPLVLNCPAPTGAGTSTNYLIEAMFQEIDASPSVLQFFNTQNPSTPLSGPNGAGTTLPTQRLCQCVVQAKPGIAATTGSQVTPSADAGWIGLYVVTVAFGQAAIAASNIAILPGAPFLSTNLLQIINSLGAPPGTYAVDTSFTPGVITASLSPALASYQVGFTMRILPANDSAGPVVANINGLGNISVTKPDGSALLQHDVLAGAAFEVVVKAGPVLQMIAWPQPPLDLRQPVKIASFAAAAGIHYACDTSGGAFTVALPPSPKYGDRVGLSDPSGAWQSNNLSINGNGSLIQGSASVFPCNINNISGGFTFRGGSYGWVWEF